MDTLRNPNINFPVMSALGATIVTIMLLIILSTLTKIEIPPLTDDRPPPILIPNTKPPVPTKLVDDQVIEPKQPELIQNVISNNQDNPQRTQIIPPNSIMKMDGLGNLKIPTIPTIEHIQSPVINEYFDMTQVDQIPRIIKRVNPIYPFSLKSRGIEGRVVLRFIVDEKGFVQKPEVLSAEHKGAFEESALAAIVKYRFKPALLNNRPVKCFVIQPIGFTLKE